MSYESKKRFVLDYLADGTWRNGNDIVDASRGKLIKSTAYATLERMEREKLLVCKEPEDAGGYLITVMDKRYRKA